jgi:four helix bundle protein
MSDYRRLKVWARAHRLVLEVYGATQRFPAIERGGLMQQMRRAASAVPTNLAEGSGRKSRKELSRYAKISLGSASELEYQLLLARDLGYLDASCHDALAESTDEVKRMLGALIRTLDSRTNTTRST